MTLTSRDGAARLGFIDSNGWRDYESLRATLRLNATLLLFLQTASIWAFLSACHAAHLLCFKEILWPSPMFHYCIFFFPVFILAQCFFLLRDPLSYFTPLPHCSVLKPHPPTEHNATIVIAFFSSSSPITENAPVMLIAHKDTEHLPAGAPHQIIS